MSEAVIVRKDDQITEKQNVNKMRDTKKSQSDPNGDRL